MAQQAHSILEQIRFHALNTPDQVALARLGPDGSKSHSITYRELDQRTAALASTLIAEGEQGRPVLIPERNSCDYVIAYLACLRAGAIAVTAYKPRSQDRSGRLHRIIDDSKCQSMLASTETIQSFQELSEYPIAGERCFATDQSFTTSSESPDLPNVNPASIAMLQYTSGSTNHPRAVALTHSNLAANLAIMSSLFYRKGSCGTVCWLPLFHDMGLIGLVMTSLVNGITANIMAPEEFVMRPLRWLKAISETRSEHSGAPNFAFQLCVDRTTPEEREGLDLSCWKSAMNGAETIRPATLRNFLDAFAPFGFDESAFQPCYGLAESTLVVATRRPGGPLTMPQISTHALQEDRIEVNSAENTDTKTVVTCGPPVPGQDVRIVKPESDTFLDDCFVGEICVRGASVASGYNNHDEDTMGTFVPQIGGEPGPWLRTGDLGSIVHNELVVVGRLKDLIIVGGMNHHPQDIEHTAEQAHPDIASSGCAVFSLTPTESSDSERVVLVVEPTRECFRGYRKNAHKIAELANEVAQATRSQISSVHAVAISACVLVKPGSIPRTTSGKIQRQKCAQLFQSNDLDTLE